MHIEPMPTGVVAGRENLHVNEIEMICITNAGVGDVRPSSAIDAYVSQGAVIGVDIAATGKN